MPPRLKSQGQRVIPARYADADNNMFNRRGGGPYVPVQHESRLVVRADLENGPPKRADSPNCGVEGFTLVLSFAASRRLRIAGADITSACVEEKEADRIFKLAPPMEGLEGILQGGALLCRVPIHDQKDAGRSLSCPIKEEACTRGWHHSLVCLGILFCRPGERVVAIFGCHVDDILSVSGPGRKTRVDELLLLFDLGIASTGKFRILWTRDQPGRRLQYVCWREGQHREDQADPVPAGRTFDVRGYYRAGSIR